MPNASVRSSLILMASHPHTLSAHRHSVLIIPEVEPGLEVLCKEDLAGMDWSVTENVCFTLCSAPLPRPRSHHGA